MPGGAPLSIPHAFESVHDWLVPRFHPAGVVKAVVEVNSAVGVIRTEHEADATEVVAVVANGLIVCPRLLMIRLCLASIHLVGDFRRLAVPLFFSPGNPLAKCFDLCRDRGERVILSRSVIFPVG